MRPSTPTRWIEEAEASRIFLLESEAQPPASNAAPRPEFLLAEKSALIVLVIRMIGRVARTARGSATSLSRRSSSAIPRGPTWGIPLHSN